jgi:branched-chain amino acid transport system substrate-binding protein
LLVPLSGPSAAIGLTMQRAATLVQPPKGDEMLIFDTGGTPAGAAAAATQAVRRGARIILGPLFAAETRPVLSAVAGRIPVVAFSNDAALLDSGAFLLGITASQTVSAILQYARGRGIRRTALMAAESGWGAQVSAAADRLQGELGVEIVRLPQGLSAENPTSLMNALRGGGGELPDALMVAEGGGPFAAAGRALAGSGVQLLGTTQALDYAPAALAAARGAWLSAPDPAGLATFMTLYQGKNGGAPGNLAALAYDGASIVEAIRATGRIDRDALLATTRFPAASGAIRFRADGSAVREMGILVAGPDGYTMVDQSAAT